MSLEPVIRPKGYTLRRTLIIVAVLLAVVSVVILPLLLISFPLLVVALVLALKNVRVDMEYWRARKAGAPLARPHGSEPESAVATEPSA